MESIEETTPKLPFDILVLIVEFFAYLPNGRGHKALSSLSRTCRLFLPICQQHIFAKISLRPLICDHWPEPSKPDSDHEVPSIALKTMKRILESNPGIADYVKTLYYHSHASNYERPSIITLLTKFERVENFCIIPYVDAMEGCYTFESDKRLLMDLYEGFDRDPPLNWEWLPLLLRDALVRIIHLPTLNTLDISMISNFPLETLLPCTDLQTLLLVKSHFLPASEHPDHNAIRPRSINLWPGAKSNARALCHGHSVGHPYLDLTQLLSLDMRISRLEDCPQLYKLLQGLERLEVFNLFFIGMCTILPSEDVTESLLTAPALKKLLQVVSNRASSLQNLRNLSVAGLSDFRDGRQIPALALLKQFPPMSRVEILVVAFAVQRTQDTHTFEELHQLALLLSTTSFGSLRSLTLSLLVRGSELEVQEVRPEVWRTRALTHMASLVNNPALDFVFIVRV